MMRGFSMRKASAVIPVDADPESAIRNRIPNQASEAARRSRASTISFSATSALVQ